MKQKYYKPLLKPWIGFDKVDEETYFATDYLTHEGHIIGTELAEFAMKLDGSYDPHKDIYQTYSPEEINDMLDKLESGGFLRHTRTSPFGKRHIPFFVSRGAVNRRLDFNPLLKVLNWILMVSWLPALCLGCMFWLNVHPIFLNGFHALIGGLIGLLLCPLLHMLAHALAVVRYGGFVFEIGIHFHGWKPQLYIFEETETASGNAQILASGAELDYLLGGVLMILAIIAFTLDFALGAAISCTLYGNYRLMFRPKMDGMRILEEAIVPKWSANEIPDYVLNWFDAPAWDEEVDDDIYQAPAAKEPFPTMGLSDKFPIPHADSLDGCEKLVKDFLQSDVLCAAIVLSIVKICSTIVYGFALLSVIADIIFALL